MDDRRDLEALEDGIADRRVRCSELLRAYVRLVPLLVAALAAIALVLVLRLV